MRGLFFSSSAQEVGAGTFSYKLESSVYLAGLQSCVQIGTN